MARQTELCFNELLLLFDQFNCFSKLDKSINVGIAINVLDSVDLYSGTIVVVSSDTKKSLKPCSFIREGAGNDQQDAMLAVRGTVVMSTSTILVCH